MGGGGGLIRDRCLFEKEAYLFILEIIIQF